MVSPYNPFHQIQLVNFWSSAIMRLNIALAIIVALALSLQGCGKKGPLILTAPQAQTPNPQKPEPQKPAASAPEQNKQP